MGGHISPDLQLKWEQSAAAVFRAAIDAELAEKTALRCDRCQHKHPLVVRLMTGERFCVPCLANHATRRLPTWQEFCEEFPEYGSPELAWRLATTERERIEAERLKAEHDNMSTWDKAVAAFKILRGMR